MRYVAWTRPGRPCQSLQLWEISVISTSSSSQPRVHSSHGRLLTCSCTAAIDGQQAHVVYVLM